MSFWKLAGQTVDVVEYAVGFVVLLLLDLVGVEGFVIEFAVFLDELFWNFLGRNGLGLDLRDCKPVSYRSTRTE